MSGEQMCRDITIYSVPGPSSAPAILKDEIVGGWAYAIENLWFLSELNPDCEIQVVFGHVTEFGPIPNIPKIPRVVVHIYETSLQKLSSRALLLAGEQHGVILNYILHSHELQTPFYAIVDPDCYIVTKNSFHKLMVEMKKFELDIIGVSYPSSLPKSYYWDFPTAYFQLMNSTKCHTKDLDFLPEYASSETGSKNDSLDKDPIGTILIPIMKLSKLLNFPLKNLLWRMQNSENSVAQLLYYFSSNYPYRNSVLWKDTGWRNRKKLEQVRTVIIPHRVNPSSIANGFNEKSYLENNIDVKDSLINPTWHVMMHGLYENRNMGDQTYFWRSLARILKGTRLDPKTFPATSVMMADSLLTKIPIFGGWGNMRYAYEYFWQGEPFCIHLGHGGKENVRKDISRLATIRRELTESDLIWSKNEFN